MVQRCRPAKGSMTTGQLHVCNSLPCSRCMWFHVVLQFCSQCFFLCGLDSSLNGTMYRYVLCGREVGGRSVGVFREGRRLDEIKWQNQKSRILVQAARHLLLA